MVLLRQKKLLVKLKEISNTVFSSNDASFKSALDNEVFVSSKFRARVEDRVHEQVVCTHLGRREAGTMIFCL